MKKIAGATDFIISADPEIRTVFDPFAGSGSMLTKALFHGWVLLEPM
jgi:hypothetical protein